MLQPTLFLVVLFGLTVAGGAAAVAPIWFLEQIYTNADGSVQFVVYSTEESGQQYLAGQTLVATGNFSRRADIAPGRLPRRTRSHFQTTFPGIPPTTVF